MASVEKFDIKYTRMSGTDFVKFEITFKPNPGFCVYYDELMLHDKGLLKIIEFIEAYKNNKKDIPKNLFFKIKNSNLVFYAYDDAKFKPVIRISDKLDIDYFLDELYAALMFNHHLNCAV